ncbi:nucleoside deaminase [Brevibacterium sp.]|uniref:nucleoside deaminase n=1 Tax=Brevibacterium sp. TaxID=1701 RepID=UPI0028110CB7|nr:nucleoside deaminase [Brevibacterium sp.]
MTVSLTELSEADAEHLRRCIELAAEALEAGDEPFGSVLVDPSGTAVFEDRNRVSGGDRTRHPEFEIARWAVANMTPEDRARSTVYTSGEHCPMCAAAHAWVGLGPIIYATGTEQTRSWYDDWGIESGPVSPLPIRQVGPGIEVRGPVEELAAEVRGLHARMLGISDELS